MALTPKDVVPELEQANRPIVEWVNRRENQLDAALRDNRADIQHKPDYVAVALRAFSPHEMSETTESILQQSAGEIEIRYRAAGWDEAKTDLGTGVLSLKRFRRHVLVTVDGVGNELRAPVFETESYEQAARRILDHGFQYGVQGGEAGLRVFNATAVRDVRIPARVY